MLLGDVLAVVATLVGLAFSSWAVLIGSALLFRRKAEISKSLIQYAPGRTFAIGFALMLLAVTISLVLLSVPITFAKFLGWSGVLVILALASLGCGGLVLLVAERLKQYDPELGAFASLSRAAIFISGAGLVPLLGLFIVFPAVLSLGVGTAAQALFMKSALQPAAEY